MSDRTEEGATLKRVKRMHDKLERIADDMRDLKQRMTAMEQQLSHFAATEASHYGSIALRLDRIEDRADRIDRKLDTDAGEDGA